MGESIGHRTESLHRSVGTSRLKATARGATGIFLWCLQKHLHNKKGGLSQTYKKNTQANAKVYDLNHKTTQALETLAFVYSTFEKAGRDLNKEDESYRRKPSRSFRKQRKSSRTLSRSRRSRTSSYPTVANATIKTSW